MPNTNRFFEQAHIARILMRWTLLLIPLSLSVGSLVAFFLWLLDIVTRCRQRHGWLLFLLPFAGIGIYFLYKLWGKNSERGNNLIMEEIHQPGGGVPARMTPLVLLTTIVTHLFGGSAGREGTAVQMGGSVACLYGKWFGLKNDDLRIMLMAGISAGFGAVFGTPVAGTVFALEVLAIGVIRYNALLPCFIASVLADMTTAAWGIHHTSYSVTSIIPATGAIPFLHADVSLLLKAILAGALFGLAAYLFSQLSHLVKSGAQQLIKIEWLIPFAGGVVIICFCYLLGTTDYLGLGVTAKNETGVSIVNAFHAGGATYWSWFWKLLFTVITLSTGFKGGEVTPLFFIGAALGNTIAIATGAPVDLFAAMGFIAVFAGATNTPLACTVMGVELFGTSYTLYFAIACFTAYYFSGHTGIYSSQRIGTGKTDREGITGNTLKQLHEQNVTNSKNAFEILKRNWKGK